MKPLFATARSVDILHSNAGIIAKPKFISDMSFDEWNRMISINLNGMFLMAKYAVTQMLKQEGGVIVFTGSNWAYVCDPGFSSYAASKGGGVAFAPRPGVGSCQGQYTDQCGVSGKHPPLRCSTSS